MSEEREDKAENTSEVTLSLKERRISITESLRFLYLSASSAAILTQRHARKHGPLLAQSALLFEEVRQQTKDELQEMQARLPFKRFFTGYAMRVWARASSLSTHKFCHEMADHMARKTLLQMQSLAKRGHESLSEAFSARFVDLSGELQKQLPAKPA